MYKLINKPFSLQEIVNEVTSNIKKYGRRGKKLDDPNDLLFKLEYKDLVKVHKLGRVINTRDAARKVFLEMVLKGLQ